MNRSYRLISSTLLAAFVLAGSSLPGAEEKPVSQKPTPESKQAQQKRLDQFTVSITSSKDGTAQKALFYCPAEAAPEIKGEPVPLLVALHTWSGGFEQGLGYLPHAQARKWILIAPHFRGPNNQPTACASDLAVQDVLDAVAYAQQHARVDAARIYVVGGSGGGHMTLVMSARAPEKWAASSVWVPIADLAAWHAENTLAKRNYAKMLEGACGGPPGPQTEAQYRARSPLFLLPAAKGLPMDINAGIHDGHTGSVPISHSLHAFNALAEANGCSSKQVAEEDIAFMVREQKVPPALVAEREADPERQKAVLFRRVAGPVRITIFEGGHDSEVGAALDWLARQRKGAAADFQLGKGRGKSPSVKEGSQPVAQ